MRIFVLRHGQAEPQKTTDEARCLTAKGRHDVAAAVKASLADFTGLQSVWESPLVRARQTAKIAQDTLILAGENFSTKISELIIPEADPYLLFEALQHSNLQSVLLVSHQPFVGDFIDILCGSEKGAHSMDTSSIACVEADIVAPGIGQLHWLRHANG